MKFLKNQFFIIFIFILPSTIGIAQSKKVPGYIVSQKGDTTRGMITNYTNWDNSQEKINFIASDNRAITVMPSEFKTVHINGFEDYFSYSGRRITNAVSITEVMNNQLDSGIKYSNISSFLRVLYTAPHFALLEFKDGERSNFFIREGDSTTELIFFRYYSNFYETNVTEPKYFTPSQIGKNPYVNQTYKQQLLVLLNKYGTETNQFIIDDLLRITYAEYDLLRFLKKWQPSAIPIRSNKTPMQLYIAGGASINSIKIKRNSSINPLLEGTYNGNTSPFGVIGLNIYSQRSFGRTFINPELRICSYKNTLIKNTTSSKISGSIALLQLNFGYNIINDENLKWYFKAGGNAGFRLNSDIV